MESNITIQEAYQLMMVLEKDIPTWEKSRIAMVLLILAANPSFIEESKPVVVNKYGCSRPSRITRIYYDDDDDWRGYCD